MEKHTNTENGTITLNIRWFSLLAQHRGKRSEELSLPSGSTGAHLIDRFCEELPVLQKYRPYIRFAVNQEYADESTILKHGDEVALITPVSGG